jgi:F-type H+-transporting ATPase subunit delta
MNTHAVATRYARALFDVAIKEADLQQVERQLADITRVFTEHDELQRVLANPAIPATSKRAIVAQVLNAEAIAPVLRKLMLMLAERDRMPLLPDLLESYRDRLMDHMKVVRANVTTAVALPSDRVEALKQTLSAVTGRQVVMTTSQDPSLIGGVVARIGSTVYDGSIKRQLEKFREVVSR